jgi:hypothetical protein
LLTFLARAQLNTSDIKSDTYFAVHKATNEIKFVKGPMTKKDVDNLLLCNEIKELLGFPTYKIETKYLKCDMFKKEENVLGLRKKMNEGWFIICENLYGWTKPEEIQTTTKTSKLYKNVEVIAYNNPTIRHVQFEDINYDFARTICLRMFMGNNDPALRNFIVNKNTDTIYSLDENVINKDLFFKYSKEVQEKIDQLLLENQAKIIEEITGWMIKCKNFFEDKNEDVNIMIKRTSRKFNISIY